MQAVRFVGVGRPAQIEDVPVITNDRVFDEYGVNRIW